MNKPKCVLISDVHFSVSTLELASNALKQAIAHAKTLDVPLVIAGDLMDSKAIIRGEVANRLIEILSSPLAFNTQITILVGNHDLINEKGLEHSLNFLAPYAEIIQSPVFDARIGATLIPYFSDSQKLLQVLETADNKYPLIMHQGVIGAEMGHYIIDKTSLPTTAFADFRVISGHYHKAQDIDCRHYYMTDDGSHRFTIKLNSLKGVFSYIGSPYTISYAEANDGPKGFRVLYEDGSLESISTNLRKHVVIECKYENFKQPHGLKTLHINEDPGTDLIWIKITGSKSDLDKLDKKQIAKDFFLGNLNFKLDKIPTDSKKVEKYVNLTDTQVLDTIIDSKADSDKYKTQLKELWRELLK